jgi:histidine triad (HIT) family protein
VNCVFCQILRGETPGTFVLRGRTCAAFMDIQPINPGHVLIVPTQHVADLHTLDASSLGELIQLGQRIAGALRSSTLRCGSVNLFLADGEAAGQEVPHLHLHVFPRFKDDGFGLRFGPRYLQLPAREELETVTAEIRAALYEVG